MTVNQICALVGSAVVAAAVVAGLYVAGAPSEERAFRLDERRVADLMALTGAIDAYRYMNESLPESLDQLIAAQRMSNLPVDPVSGELYSYEITEPKAYRLCADFEKPSREPDDRNFWQHEAGTDCFEITVGDSD